MRNGHFEICQICDGHGKHSQHLGSFTKDEFDQAFDDEESRQNYFDGAYDRPCEPCKGSGKVWVDDSPHDDGLANNGDCSCRACEIVKERDEWEASRLQWAENGYQGHFHR